MDVSDVTTTAKTIAIVHRRLTILKSGHPMLASRLRAGDPEAQAEFLRRQDTPKRIILIPQQWITYDGPLLSLNFEAYPIIHD